MNTKLPSFFFSILEDSPRKVELLLNDWTLSEKSEKRGMIVKLQAQGFHDVFKNGQSTLWRIV